MIEFFRGNYPAIGRRLFQVFRWTLFLVWLDFLRFILFEGAASNNWFGYLFWRQIGSWLGLSIAILVAQWVLIGQLKPKVFLPWTKIDWLEIKSNEHNQTTGG